MNLNATGMSIVDMRWRPVAIVVAVLVLYFVLQIWKLMGHLGQHLHKDTLTESVKFVYSNEMVFEAIRTIRDGNCDLYADKFKDICTTERARALNISSNGVWKRRLPGCIIIGTYKSGTRELIDFLYMHPQVVIRREPSYEVAFFDKNVDKGIDWYKDAMPESLPGQITIEKSPSYFYSEQTPRRIHNMNSSVRLILMVREPLDRALSEFSFDVTVAHAQFGGSLYNCAVDPWTGKINANCFVIRHSVYDAPLGHYLQYFDRQHILIIDADDFRNNPYRVLRQVEDHMGLVHAIREANFVYNPHKDAYCVDYGSHDNVSACYGMSRGRTGYNVTLPDSVRQRLGSLFTEHNERFFKLAGKRFPWK